MCSVFVLGRKVFPPPALVDNVFISLMCIWPESQKLKKVRN